MMANTLGLQSVLTRVLGKSVNLNKQQRYKMIAGTGDASNTSFLDVAAAVMGDGCILAVYNVYDGWWGDDDTWVVVEDEDGRQ